MVSIREASRRLRASQEVRSELLFHRGVNLERWREEAMLIYRQEKEFQKVPQGYGCSGLRWGWMSSCLEANLQSFLPIRYGFASERALLLPLSPHPMSLPCL